jgi:spore coat polysaccharide biosynthesis protein SpsF (cytidylyltransferase family)
MLDLASKMGVASYLGSEHDVLNRYVCAARSVRADVVMRITGDCPFIEPEVCRRVLGPFSREERCDYASNMHPVRTYPKGLDCEVFTSDLLVLAEKNATDKYDREHVTPWIQRHGGYSIEVTHDDFDESAVNWCVDYPEDIERLSMRLVNAYRIPEAVDILYQLLGERDESVNISHQGMPTLEQHVDFVKSRPYPYWYLIEAMGEWVGATYLTDRDEIGIFILKDHQGKGHGKKAVNLLMQTVERPRYLANINPANGRSKTFFEHALGFNLLQQTYEYVPE